MTLAWNEAEMALQNCLEGWAEAAWVGSLLVILVLGGQQLLRRWISPGWMYLIWIVVMIRFVCLWVPASHWSLESCWSWPTHPGVETVILDSPTSDSTSEWSVAPPMASTQVVSVPLPEFGDSVAPKVPWLLALMVVWAIVVAGLLIRLARSSIRLMTAVRRDSTSPEKNLKAMIFRLGAQMNVRQRFEICLTEVVAVPAVLGWWKPKLLIPKWCLLDLERDQLELAIIHELVHLKRRDHWIQLGMYLVRVLNWFNPLVWIGERRVARFRELACDQRVLTIAQSLGHDSPQRYGATLLQVLEKSQSAKPLAWMPRFVGNQPSLVQERIQNMIVSRHLLQTRLGAGLALVWLAMLLVSGFTSKQMLAQCDQASSSQDAFALPTRLPTLATGINPQRFLAPQSEQDSNAATPIPLLRSVAPAKASPERSPGSGSQGVRMSLQVWQLSARQLQQLRDYLKLESSPARAAIQELSAQSLSAIQSRRAQRMLGGRSSSAQGQRAQAKFIGNLELANCMATNIDFQPDWSLVKAKGSDIRSPASQSFVIAPKVTTQKLTVELKVTHEYSIQPKNGPAQFALRRLNTGIAFPLNDQGQLERDKTASILIVNATELAVNGPWVALLTPEELHQSGEPNPAVAKPEVTYAAPLPMLDSLPVIGASFNVPQPVQPPLVRYDMRIAEVSEVKASELREEWQMSQSADAYFGSGKTIRLKNKQQEQAFLKLVDDSEIKLGSKIHLMTCENLEGRITRGAEVPRPQGATIRANGELHHDVDFVNVGQTISVTPRLLEDDQLVTHLEFESSRLDDVQGSDAETVVVGVVAGKKIRSPQIKKSETQNAIQSRCGETVVDFLPIPGTQKEGGRTAILIWSAQTVGQPD